MTQIDFHVNAPGKLAYACRLARKIYGTGQPVVFHAGDATLATFDRLLWTFSQLDFIPHCRVTDRLAKRTPVLLAGPDERSVAPQSEHAPASTPARVASERSGCQNASHARPGI